MSNGDSKKKKIKVDPVKCIGCGLCTSIAEECFKLNDDGKAVYIDEDKVDEEKIKEAIESCPVEAISKDNE